MHLYSFAHSISLSKRYRPTDMGGAFFIFERAYCGNLRRSLRIIKSLAIAVVIPFLFFLLRPPTPPEEEWMDDWT